MSHATHADLPPRVVVFAKSPQPGVAKTRLIPALGQVPQEHLRDTC
jgi:glycosyltransferase A (GT-A) superfamily protein (DUF2064 family)